MQPWDAAFEAECNHVVATICADGVSEKQRQTAWRSLMGKVAPHIEKWAAASPVLRRCGLSSEDEVRTVLVNVLSRLNAKGFDNLRGYLARKPAAAEEEAEAVLVEGVVRLVHAGEPESAIAPVQEDLRKDTPLRGWLFLLTRFAVKDHVKLRFGWSTSVRVAYGLERARGAAERSALEQAVRCLAGVISADLDEKAMELGVEYLPGTARPEHIEAAITSTKYRIVTMPDLRRSRRDLVTGAERFDAITEAGARPPMTDALTLHRLMAEVTAFMETFPEAMRKSVRLWLDDETFEAIAVQVEVEDAERARALVRAGMARLRERFRGQWSAIFEG
jgi:hypothetical protein